jgi:hypothetical protein
MCNVSSLLAPNYIYAFYVTSVISICVADLKTPIDTQSNITALKIVNSLPSSVTLAAHYTVLLAYISFLLERFLKQNASL